MPSEKGKQVIERYKNGESMANIAQDLGMNRSYCYAILRNNRIEPRMKYERGPDGIESRVNDLLDDTTTKREIAEHLGISLAYCAVVVRRVKAKRELGLLTPRV